MNFIEFHEYNVLLYALASTHINWEVYKFTEIFLRLLENEPLNPKKKIEV